MSKSKISVVLSLLLVGGLLTSCGVSAEEKALVANCKKMYTYLKSVEDSPEVFENSTYADSDSVALLLGTESRKVMEQKILGIFPFLDEIIVGRGKDKQYIDLYYYSGSIYLIQKALEGTDIKFPFSEAEMKKMTTTSDNYSDSVAPFAQKVFGNYVDLKNHQGCGAVDNKDGNSDSEKSTSLAFHRASDVYLLYASFLQAKRDCDVSGWHQGNKCAKNDYVSKPDNYTPSNELTQEEKDILAEREKSAQNGGGGSSGSSGYSNVSPGQICNSLGAVVKTENYGKLTCKLLIFRGLEAQMWMRS